MLESRILQIIEVPSSSRMEIFSPEKCILIFKGTGVSIDVGACCYAIRSFEKRKANAKITGVPVKLSSIVDFRINIFRKFIIEILYGSFSNQRPASLMASVMPFVKFFQWNDSEGPKFDICSEVEVYELLDMYVDYLVVKVRQGQLSNNTAAGYYQSVEKIFLTIFEGGRKFKKKYKFQFSSSHVNKTDTVSTSDQAKVISLCQMVFDQVYDLIVNKKKFPFRFEVPSYLNWPSNETWIVPLKTWIVPGIVDSRFKGRPASCFDYKTGTLFELNGHETIDNDKILKARACFLKAIDKANADYKCASRITIAMIAHNAFFLLFLAQSGLNLAVALEIEEFDILELSKVSPGLRSIKFRAGGKNINIEIPLAMVSRFKNFLRLRSFILGELECKSLFFALNPRMGKKPNKLGSGIFTTFYKTLNRIDPDLPKITSQQWRAVKADWAVRKYNVTTASAILQNTPTVFLRSYINGSSGSQKNEFADFYDSIIEFSARKFDADNFVLTPVGGCLSYGKPESILPSLKNEIVPNCRQYEGCFGCRFYRVHADDQDLRKLISCRFCINSIRHLSQSQEQFDYIFNHVLGSINNILDMVRRKSQDLADLIVNIENDITENGVMDEYWRHHYDMLVAIGVIGDASNYKD